MIKINVREELIKFISDKPPIKCILLEMIVGYSINNKIKFMLKEDYNSKEFEIFIRSIDFNYDNGYGSQNLYGNIWFIDGTWGSRRNYDGMEWWEYNVVPVIPEELKLK